MKRIALLLSLPLLLGAAAPSGPPEIPAEIRVSNGWVRYMLPSLPAAAYMDLNNVSDTTTKLTGASSPACGSLMLHKSEEASGTSTMSKASSITIPAHETVKLSAGGYHLMCMEPNMKEGSKIGITLNFSDGSALLLLLPVYGPSGPPAQ